VPGHLVAILHSKPVGSGSITRRRVESARKSLSCRSASIANIYDAQLGSSADLSGATDFEAWHRARLDIGNQLSVPGTSDVLLGYGVQPPSGAHLVHYREQIRWLESIMAETGLRVWTVGGRPSHPSRWQRITSRMAPGVELEAALKPLLMRHR
jgi:hypothetical protein